MYFRFDADELALLRAAESFIGTRLTRLPHRPDALRSAMALARAALKASGADAGSMVNLAEADVRLLAEAVRATADEVQWLVEQGEVGVPTNDRVALARRAALGEVFPDLLERGSWRTFGLSRSLALLARRLAEPLAPTHGR